MGTPRSANKACLSAEDGVLFAAMGGEMGVRVWPVIYLYKSLFACVASLRLARNSKAVCSRRPFMCRSPPEGSVHLCELRGGGAAAPAAPPPIPSSSSRSSPFCTISSASSSSFASHSFSLFSSSSFFSSSLPPPPVPWTVAFTPSFAGRRNVGERRNGMKGKMESE